MSRTFALPAGRGARAALVPVRLYQRWISPGLPPTCRFHPTCSAYAVDALTGHGLLRGCWLTLRRLLRCGPWHPGGLDPVPPAPDGTPAPRPPAESEPPC
ncbi:MAG: membrane protein insertion efficiency factor YidD [Actinomycetota bacterium]|nr:membrane protein insertion efficiency factor YidD [Actinomycetota bacterium]